MTQLILTIMAIALSAALIVATVNYMPSWPKQAEITQTLGKTGFTQLQAAYKGYHTANGVVPEPNADPDGGLATHFTPYLDFVPRAPDGYYWTYGRQLAGNLDHFFCLAPEPGTATGEGDYRGLMRLRAIFPSDQFIVHDDGLAGCGVSPVTAERPAELGATLFVRARTP